MKFLYLFIIIITLSTIFILSFNQESTINKINKHYKDIDNATKMLDEILK